MPHPKPRTGHSHPTPEKRAQLRAFKKIRSNVVKKWLEPSNTSESAFEEEKDDWLARTIYGHLAKMVQQNRWQILVDEVDYARPLKAGQHSIEGRPFKIGLIAFLGDTIAMGRTRRSELSDAMEYAYRHGVPSRYFNGFVKQAGLRKIAKKLKAGHREPGFTGRQNAHASED